MPLNIHDGSSWNPLKKASVFDGTSWQDAKYMFIYDGSQWQPVQSMIPENTVSPSFSYSDEYAFNGVGQTITVSNGTWTNNPTSYSYRWYKAPWSPTTLSWQEVGSLQTLELTEEFVGYYVKCTVTATNSYGSGTKDFESPNIFSPKKMADFLAYVVSNDIVRLIFTKPLGADSFYLQYQGPNVPNTSLYIDATSAETQTFDIDLGTADGTLGIYLAGTNKNNPLSSVVQYLSGMGKNASILDLKIYKPSTSATASATGQYEGTIVWTNQNIVQTSWEVYHAELEGLGALYTGTTETSAVVPNYTPGTTSGPWFVKVTGTGDRYSSPTTLQTNNVTFTTTPMAAPINTISPSISLTTARNFSVSQGTWTTHGHPTTYSYQWKSNGSSIQGATGTSYISTSTYDNTNITCVVTASNDGSSASATSNSILQTAPAVVPTGGSVILSGTGEPGKVIYAETTGWQNYPTSYSVIITTAYSPNVPTVNSQIVAFSINSNECSYEVTASDAISPKNVFKAFALASNEAGSSDTVSSSTITANYIWYCTTAVQGSTTCGYSTSSTNVSGSGSGYSTTCLTSGYPACPSDAVTPPVATPPTPPVATPPTPPVASTLNTYSYSYYDGKCNWAVYNSSGSYLRAYSTNLCQNSGTDESGATLPNCNNASCTGAATPPVATPPTPPVATPPATATWHCAVTYYNTQIPGESFDWYEDLSTVTCGSERVVCSQSSYPSLPARPPACSTPPVATPPTPPVATPPTPPVATPPTPPVATPPTPPVATPPTPPVATPPTPPVATPPSYSCDFAACGNDPGKLCCYYVGGNCKAC